MIFLLLLIPILSSLIMWRVFSNKITIGEVFIPTGISFLIIVIGSLVGTKSTSSYETWGSIITKVEYYEEWSTWVEETCTRSFPCGSDDKGNTRYCTETYDCSYCSYHDPKWIAYDDAGNAFDISEQYYNYLIKKWSATPTFVDQHRRINKHWNCGKDGNMYYITWNNLVETSESATTSHYYENRVKATSSAFNLPYISKDSAKILGLYDYPKQYNFYKQSVVLGLDRLYKGADLDKYETYFQYLNGYYGPRSKVKLFICLFWDKPIDIAYKQEAYWYGGNQNEIVICIGLNSSKEIQWVKPFSWTDQKRILVDLREDIAESKVFDPMVLYGILAQDLKDQKVYKDFKKDFSYLKPDIPTSTYIIILVLIILTTCISLGVVTTNDIDPKEDIFKK